MILVIDTRERFVLPFIDENIKDYPYIQKQINTGDYLICSRSWPAAANITSGVTSGVTNGVTSSVTSSVTSCVIIENDNFNIFACIERKTYNDFAASFRDGRYTAGIEKMKKLRSETNCQLFFFIEGVAFPAPNRKFSRIPYACILGAMTTMMIRDNIFVIQTENEQHTAKRLNDLMKAYDTTGCLKDNEWSSFIGRRPLINIGGMNNVENNNVENNNVKNNNVKNNNVKNTTQPNTTPSTLLNVTLAVASQEKSFDHCLSDNRLTQRIEKTTDEIITKSWASLKGISIVIGKMLCDKYTIASVVLKKIPIEELKQFKTASGKVANKDAIYSILSIREGFNQINYCKMIAAIPGITLATAIYILKTKRMEQICTMTVTEMENIMIPRGKCESKLGKKSVLLFSLLNSIN